MIIDKSSEKSLYEQLYESFRNDILSGKFMPGERLPSKRSLAEQLSISVITVENAYSQLIDEGYVSSEERSGYFVRYSGEAMKMPEQTAPPQTVPVSGENIEDGGVTENFPFSVWAKLMRAVIKEKGTSLLVPVPGEGAAELRTAISGYLYRIRGISVSAERIIIGAGTEYLYNLLIQLLGRNRVYGVEDPGYRKLSKIYAANDVKCSYINLDGQGMSCSELEKSGASVAHISPAHHFPTGIIMPISRRREIMNWAGSSKKRFIIEDDYDSEFRWSGRPVPTIFGMDTSGKAVYMNTFSQTIAPSVRISYMCLPENLYGLWKDKMSFYSCPVPSFEQYTLARFISGGYFERHINRMKKHYRRVRELVLELAETLPQANINEENSGLHFLISAECSKKEISDKFEPFGIKVTPLSNYYNKPNKAGKKQFVIGYFYADEQKLENGF